MEKGAGNNNDKNKITIIIIIMGTRMYDIVFIKEKVSIFL